MNLDFNSGKSISCDDDIFENENFGCQDTKSFLKAQTMMGTEKKFRNYKDNGVPGPGNYTIRSFAEEISKKGEEINKIRKAINEKENYKIDLKKKRTTNIINIINDD